MKKKTIVSLFRNTDLYSGEKIKLTMFNRIYICEQLFTSKMKRAKNRLQILHNDGHLDDQLKGSG